MFFIESGETVNEHKKKLLLEDTTEASKTIITSYLGFSVDEILLNNDALIFGGCLRDIIAGDSNKINDIDILVCPKANRKIGLMLIEKGYVCLENMMKIDFFELYAKVSVHFPATFFKDGHKVQLIRPRFESTELDEITHHPVASTYSLNSLQDFAKEVDLSCCGLIYHPTLGLREVIENAITHCQSKTLKILEDNKFYYKKRTEIRTWKLMEKGWK